LIECRLPFRRNPRRLDVYRRHVPAQRLTKNVIEVPPLLLPIPGYPTGLERHRTALPDVLDSGTNDLLRVNIPHLRREVCIVGGGPHITPTVEPPTRAMLRSIR